MQGKTSVVEQHYTKEQLESVRKGFALLKKARHSKSVREYARKLKAEIEA